MTKETKRRRVATGGIGTAGDNVTNVSLRSRAHHVKHHHRNYHRRRPGDHRSRTWAIRWRGRSWAGQGAALPPALLARLLAARGGQ